MNEKPKRDWQRVTQTFAQNCEVCARLIVPGEERFADGISVHLVREETEES